jgi:hypothetical protein
VYCPATVIVSVAEPDVGWVPDQPPTAGGDALQLSALTVDHVSVKGCPVVTALAELVRVTVGATTVKVVCALTVAV